MNPIYLHLGAGTRKIPGFINIDIEPGADLQLDLTEPLPWSDRSVAGIFSEHFIEHVTQTDAIRLLHECHRVLKPGATLRISTPDLQDMIADYMSDRIHPDWEKYGMTWTANRCERFNIRMRWWGHQWLYDEAELTRLGCMVGFELKGRFAIGESQEPAFRNLEHREAPGLILEFRKPDRMLARDAEPLVSITIPTYKPQFFEAALKSALNQTYRHTEIVICDDCPDDGIAQIVARYADEKRIRYIRNPQRLGRENLVKCVDEAHGEFIKFLNDDDLLAPHCIERMLDCYRQCPDLTLVTSKRDRIDEQGNRLPDIFETLRAVEQDAAIDGLSLGAALLSSCRNFVGEPTTAMFRKSDIADLVPDYLAVDNHKICGVNDVAAWCNLVTKGNVAYLVEPLSQFRIHPDQAQLNLREQIVTSSIEGIKTMRASWDRRGLSKGQYFGTIRWKPLSQPDGPWQFRTIRDQAQGWMAVTAPAISAPTPISDTATDPDWTAYCKAEQLQKAGREQEALTALLGLAQAGTTCWQVYNDLGAYAFNAGDATGALDLLRHATGLSATPTVASLNLANVLAAGGEPDEARQLLDGYLTHHPDDSAAKELMLRVSKSRPNA